MRSLVHLTERPSETRRRADENFFRIERALAAEAAADIRRDHAEPMAGHVERVASASRTMPGICVAECSVSASPAAVVFGETGARLDRHRGLAVHAEAPLDRAPVRRKRGIDIAALELAR